MTFCAHLLAHARTHRSRTKLCNRVDISISLAIYVDGAQSHKAVISFSPQELINAAVMSEYDTLRGKNDNRPSHVARIGRLPSLFLSLSNLTLNLGLFFCPQYLRH